MSEADFTWQDYEYKKSKTFYTNFYPISKEASEKIDYDSMGLPEEINIVSFSLISGNALIGYDNSCAVNHVEAAGVNFEIPDSSIDNVDKVKAIVDATRLSFLGNLFASVKLGEDPELVKIYAEFPQSLGGMKIESIGIEYSLEGKKIKKLNQITLTCIVTNISNEKRMAGLYLSAENGVSSKLIGEPSIITVTNGFADDSVYIDAGKSATLRLCIFSGATKFEDVGVALPVHTEFPNTYVYPFLRVYGNASVETKELIGPVGI